MQKLALVLSIVAAGVAGWSAWDASNLRSEIRRLNDDLAAQTSVETRVATLEKAAAARPPEAPAPVAAPSASSAVDDPATLGGSGGAPGARAAASPTKTIEEMEKRIAALEKGPVGRMLESGGPQPFPAPPRAPGAPGGPAMRWGALNFYGSVDDAAKDLDLTNGQRSDFDRAVADAKRDLDDLHRMPDEEGKTWDDAQKDMIKVDGSGGIKLDTSRLQAFKGKTVPGRNETYGAADARIRGDAKAKMRSSLTSEQQAKFDKANADPLLGGGGTGVTYSVFTSPLETTGATPK